MVDIDLNALRGYTNSLVAKRKEPYYMTGPLKAKSSNLELIEKLTERMDESEALILFINDRLDKLIDGMDRTTEIIEQIGGLRRSFEEGKGEDNA